MELPDLTAQREEKETVRSGPGQKSGTYRFAHCDRPAGDRNATGSTVDSISEQEGRGTVPIVGILANVVARGARRVRGDREPALLRDVLEDRLAEWGAADVPEADDEYRDALRWCGGHAVVLLRPTVDQWVRREKPKALAKWLHEF